METIYSIKQAQTWFDTQTEPVICVNKYTNEHRTCNTFDEAKNFYVGVSSTPTSPVDDEPILGSSISLATDWPAQPASDPDPMPESDPTPDTFESGGGDFGGAGGGSDW